VITSNTPETDAAPLRSPFHRPMNKVDIVWPEFARKLERERDEAREENAKLRNIAERAINYLDQSYRDGFCDEASDLRAELNQLKEGAK